MTSYLLPIHSPIVIQQQTEVLTIIQSRPNTGQHRSTQRQKVEEEEEEEEEEKKKG